MTEQGAERSVLEGAVSSLIFQNEENGYTILRLDVGEEEMTVVGYIDLCIPRGGPGSTSPFRASGCATPPTACSSGRMWWSAACPRG